MTTVLIVDDDRAMVGTVAALLGQEGFDIAIAYDGEAALRRHAEERPDLVILDRGLPGLSGDEVCRRLRAAGPTPILMLTGEKGTDERAKLLDLGADDYLEKPFGKKELTARIRALLRRAHISAVPSAPTRMGTLEIDRSAHFARVGAEPLPLTATEFRLLAALAARPGQLVDRAALLRAGWPDERDPDPEWLKAHLARLRAKLQAAGAPLPENVRGVGYRLG